MVEASPGRGDRAMGRASTPRRRVRRGLVVTALVVAAALAAAAPPVGAEPYEDGQASWAPGRYSSTPRTGWMTAARTDRVYDIAQIGDRIYVAGTFRGIRYGRSGAVSHRAYLVAFDRSSGEPLWGFDPRFDAPVHTLAVSADGRRLYAGGAFRRVDGRPRRGLVALAPGGRVDPRWRADVGRGNVWSLVATDSYLFVGGSFGSLGGARRVGLARLHRSTGRVDGAWSPEARGGTVLTLELPPGRNRLYVGGRFTSIDGRPGTADLVALDPWRDAIDRGFSRQPGRDVLDVLADGRGRVWLALDGDGGQAEVLGGGGRVLRSWPADGDVQTVERIGDRVFFGGHELDDGSVATVDYDDPGSWDTQSFRPVITGGEGVWAFHADGRHLWVGAQADAAFTGLARYAAR